MGGRGLLLEIFLLFIGWLLDLEHELETLPPVRGAIKGVEGSVLGFEGSRSEKKKKLKKKISL